eukprot:gnl/TRDRNA2_/TRDRNA2_131871_c4_seq2.p1 gnl/TRDRNA2_/TRDRNA2_131871_c4~~gnl/TRDRNA2_/TRDRNA2_131871_c4_seq2.p1  ORF type:complete len:108 (-),score=7.57 gnl/TRDRNA2_/TRDRNA2_131871_c4_seq2:150-473(-)
MCTHPACTADDGLWIWNCNSTSESAGSHIVTEPTHERGAGRQTREGRQRQTSSKGNTLSVNLLVLNGVPPLGAAPWIIRALHHKVPLPNTALNNLEKSSQDGSVVNR